MTEEPTLDRRDGLLVGRFTAMASPCEVLMDTDDPALGWELTRLACREARRVECKFSRYRSDNIVHRINRGAPVEVDAETADLLDYASRCHELSAGSFDITSGVLREVWRFDG
ncbi:MAG TPA: FAD:protein FMN transferase, partial [Gammaproteobacteria bacterium]|nr:FAD:protein FMN transferase [Gammaproteobacteria bacterium]